MAFLIEKPYTNFSFPAPVRQQQHHRHQQQLQQQQQQQQQQRQQQRQQQQQQLYANIGGDYIYNDGLR